MNEGDEHAGSITRLRRGLLYLARGLWLIFALSNLISMPFGVHTYYTHSLASGKKRLVQHQTSLLMFRKRGLHMGVCRVRALIKAPLPQVWEFLIKPEHMHLWGPPTRPVTGIDRPFQAGDRVTLYRRDFFRNHSQVLLVEKVVPYHSLHFRDLSPGAVRINVTASISVEEAADREATWIEEAIFYSLGKSRVMQWLDRSLVNPVLQLVAGYNWNGTNKAFRRLQAILQQSHAPVSS